uniref:Uncharacterized protein n=1 Tax=Vespula pensylvanica TaxID=30213 RepID=A0A834P5M6_VESPE|nr:hypothetical protein H0235_005897 [Vespula pensylvanica]
MYTPSLLFTTVYAAAAAIFTTRPCRGCERLGLTEVFGQVEGINDGKREREREREKVVKRKSFKKEEDFGTGVPAKGNYGIFMGLWDYGNTFETGTQRAWYYYDSVLTTEPVQQCTIVQRDWTREH